MKKITLSLLISVSFCIISNAQWTNLNPMNSVRSSHVSSMFLNGKIFVAGGFNSSFQIKDAEIYDPATGIWSTTQSEMEFYHSSGSASILSNDKILVVGGWTGSENTKKCEIYDLATDSWSTTNDLTIGRSYHTATKLDNGKILIVGGYDGFVNLTSCELFDPTTNTWSNAGSMSVGRSYHTATLLNDGRVLVAGGYNPDFGFQLNTTEIYNPTNNTWTSGPQMAIGRSYHAASKLENGNVLISGGEVFTGATPFAYEAATSVEVFNSSNNTLSLGTSLPTGLCYHHQVTIGNYVLAIGGKEKTDYLAGNFTSIPGKTYLFNVTTNSWELKPMSNDGRAFFTVEQANDFKTYVIGGETDEVELFDMNLANLSEKAILEFNFHPNPCNNNLTIESLESNFNVKVVNLNGETLKELVVNSTNKSIDINDLIPGMYLLELTNENGKSSKRFVKN
jgi:N-acetylneuraminic acid mutarotase